MYLCYVIIISVNILTCFCSSLEASDYLSKENIKLWYNNFTKKASPTNPHCSICCVDTTKDSLTKICGKHTMCIYQSGQYGAGCKGVLDIPFQQQEIEVIVDAHNTLRNRIALGLEDRGNPGPQPPASNMREIEWNKELADVAHRWASQCVYAHDLCRDLDKFPVGQNIAKGSFATNYDISFIAAWYDQVQWMNELDLQSYQIAFQSPLRYYTQLIWADSYQIGCARVLFEHDNGANITYHEHFICNYGPSGNLPGQSVYKKGPPCTNCPEGTGCSILYPGLCKNEFFYDIPEINIDDDNLLRNKECIRQKRSNCNKNTSQKNCLSRSLLFVYFIHCICMFKFE